MMTKVKELIQILNTTDESTKIEAKQGSSIDRSVMETICAFSNEPRLNGGYNFAGIKT